MSDKWISVNERQPEDGSKPFLVLTDEGKTPVIAHLSNGAWFTIVSPGCRIPNVTHWMDLPEPPPPPPADPFEAWWESVDCLYWRSDPEGTARSIWNAAKAHYERPLRPLPDFEAWQKANGGSGPCCVIVRGQKYFVFEEVARSIWNAAQGKGA